MLRLGSLDGAEVQRFRLPSGVRLGVRARKTLGPDGELLVVVRATSDLEGLVFTYNGKGYQLAALGAADGAGTLTTLDGKGRQVVTIGATVEAEGRIATYNREGQELVAIGATTGGEGAIAGANRSGGTPRCRR